MLVGDPAKAKRQLGWQATTNLPELAEIMVEAELAQLAGG
jgi:GDPmannose 4,6-dehydratase